MREAPLVRRGRGSVSNETGRFESQRHADIDDGWSSWTSPETTVATQWRPDSNRTIITRNQSPDIHFDRSINPYRGCEHGCIYCFARPSHTYLGHSAGLDFETMLYAKCEAPNLLRNELSKRNYQCEPVAIGVNTDAYQPLEKKLQITRSILKVLLETKHPAYLITKSSLIERDIDLLTEMAKQNLVSACITITTLDRKLARNLEPRATTPSRRLKTLEKLSNAGIPTRVSVSPVIPALNEEELDSIVKAAANAGAQAAYAIVLRLPHELQQLFPQCIGGIVVVIRVAGVRRWRRLLVHRRLRLLLLLSRALLHLALVLLEILIHVWVCRRYLVFQGSLVCVRGWLRVAPGFGLAFCLEWL